MNVKPLKKAAHQVIEKATPLLARVPFGGAPAQLLLPITGNLSPVMAGHGETVVLCGVYRDSTVRTFANTVGPSGRVIVVEASPDDAKRLSANWGDQQNVTIVHAAIWHEDGEIEFLAAPAGEMPDFNRIDGAGIEEFPHHMVAEPMRVPVRAVRLETLLAELGVDHVHHLNLTINGAEVHVVEGPSQTFVRDHVERLYANVEWPNPGQRFVDGLAECGMKIRVDERTAPTNKSIVLRRVYAHRPKR